MKRFFSICYLHDNSREIELQGKWVLVAFVVLWLSVIYAPDGSFNMWIFLGLTTIYSSRMFYSKYSLSASLRVSYRERVKCIYLFIGIWWLAVAVFYTILGFLAKVQNDQELVFYLIFLICLSFMLLPLIFMKSKIGWWCCWALEMAAVIGYHHGIYTLVTQQGTRNLIVAVTLVVIVVLGWLWSNRLVHHGKHFHVEGS